MVLAPEAERPDAGTPGWRGNVTFEGEYPTFDLAAFEVRSIHWSPYDPVRVVNADP